MKRRFTRRKALATTLVSAGYFLTGSDSARSQPPRSPNERLRFGCVGVGKRGGANTDDASRAGDVVALCDTDEKSLEGKAKLQPQAAKYFDFRKMLEEQGKSIDAVVVSTADHTHAVVALMAMRMGKHVYCEKPLCRYIAEARQLGAVAKETGVVTQLGNQGSSNIGFRKSLDAVRSGAIGAIQEVHVWSGRYRRPSGTDAAPNTSNPNPPATLHWNEWIGPAAMTDYSPDYESGKWQGWWPFGTGPIGDAASHVMNLAFHAADLRNAISVEAEHSGHNKIAFPKSSHVTWHFAATARRPALSLHWYDGDHRPPAKVLQGLSPPLVGCLIVGERGSISSVDDMNANWIMLPDKQPLPLGADFFGSGQPHFKDFADAIVSRGVTISNFADVAGPFTETLLSGNLAIWAGRKIESTEIDAAAKGEGELALAVRPTYRAGYVL